MQECADARDDAETKSRSMSRLTLSVPMKDPASGDVVNVQVRADVEAAKAPDPWQTGANGLRRPGETFDRALGLSERGRTLVFEAHAAALCIRYGRRRRGRRGAAMTSECIDNDATSGVAQK